MLATWCFLETNIFNTDFRRNNQTTAGKDLNNLGRVKVVAISAVMDVALHIAVVAV